MTDTEETRVERDSMGEMRVPINAYYGASTQRAVLNFPISWTGNFTVVVSELPSPTAPVMTPCPIVLT